MDIPEVPIGLDNKKKKKVSPRLQRAINEFLAGNDLSVEQLTEEQLKYVKQHVQHRRSLVWTVPILLIAAVAIALAAYYFYHGITTEESFILFGPPEQIVMNSETQEIIDTPPQIIESFKVYGKACALFSFAVAIGFCQAAVYIIAIIATTLILRRERRKLEAFLPAIKAAYENQQINSDGT